MNTQLTTSKLNSFENILPPDDPAQDAIALLKDHNGDIEASFEELYFQKYGSIPDFPDKSLWEVTLNQLRQELCGILAPMGTGLVCFRSIIQSTARGRGKSAIGYLLFANGNGCHSSFVIYVHRCAVFAVNS